MINIEYWLKLRHAPGLSSSAAQSLIEHFENINDIVYAKTAQLKQIGLSNKTIEYLKSNDQAKSICDELKWLEQENHHIVTIFDPDYPSRLKNINNPPLMLYVKGNKDILCDLQLAIIGSRNPTPTGLETAYEFAQSLANSGLIITSGLALGIDGASHKGALAAEGPTIGVMATGLDIIYPRTHKNLATEILDKGALVSEYPLTTQPRPERFPQRNRIISGLSIGTLVVEAATRSGSLITARHALEQSREVFAIPGSIHNPLAKGCHQLIRDGAKLVESVKDILEELAPQIRCNLDLDQTNKTTVEIDLDADYLLLLEAMGYEPTSIDALVSRCQMPTESISSMLLMLELKGLIATGTDGRYSRLFTN